VRFHHIYLDYMRELALAIIEDDKEKAQKTLVAIDKHRAQERLSSKITLGVLISIPLLSAVMILMGLI